MPIYKVYATVTIEVTREVEADDEDEAELECAGMSARSLLDCSEFVGASADVTDVRLVEPDVAPGPYDPAKDPFHKWRKQK